MADLLVSTALDPATNLELAAADAYSVTNIELILEFSPGASFMVESDLQLTATPNIPNNSASRSLQTSTWPQEISHGQGDSEKKAIEENWIVRAPKVFRRLDEKITENKIYVEELERYEHEFRKRVDDIHKQLEDFNMAIQSLGECFDHLRTKIAAEQNYRLAIKARINEIIRNFA